jgi:hypothetical protein
MNVDAASAIKPAFDRLPLALLTTICIVIAMKSLTVILSDRPEAEADHVAKFYSARPGWPG